MTALAEIQAGLPEALINMRPAALSMTRNRADAEDLLQQTAVKALNGAQYFKEGTNLSGWLWVILRNEFINRCRQGYRRPECLDDVPEPTIPEVQIDKIHDAEVHKAIAALSPAYRAVIEAICVQGMSYEEAAAHLKICVGSVKSRLWRGRAKLIKAIA